ncbi:phosphotransferase [Nocardioides sp. Leaf307]|uniref:phosphotransferase n=1 Tax=Nocardioides sp. Leaf307 TaxID=1736331 RepID=UPI000703812F|nr:phosphotransferase [Nocardioides sp. Leaf307]KQQ41493.1 hypothetical protein ASF50_10865 [Nocardioides sp. Leaf307]
MTVPPSEHAPEHATEHAGAPGDLAAGLRPLEGGFSGETFLAETGGERSVVRIYAGGRGPVAPSVDAAVLRLARGTVPVPQVLEVRHGDPDRGLPGLLVTSFLPGTRGDLVLRRADPLADLLADPLAGSAGAGAEVASDEALAALGEELGGALARLAGIRMLRWGPFVDADLSVGVHAPPYDVDGLPALVEVYADRLDHLTPGEWTGLRAAAVDAQAALDAVEGVCLVHSDANPKNLLLDPARPAGERLTGLVDWEYAHAGLPFTDLGNLVRHHRAPVFQDAAVATYADALGVGVQEALVLARAADLGALVDLASRRGDNPAAARADVLLRAIARAGDAAADEPAG